MTADRLLAELADLVKGVQGLELLVLFGSRARGDEREDSDWDFGYLGSSHFDPEALRAALVERLNTERIDLVDLQRAGGQLRFRAARDGRAIVEHSAGEFARFWFDAVSFWCDVQPILRAGYDRILAELKP